METEESDYQAFSCAHCHEETIGFVFWDEKKRKFCSALHRRQHLEAEKAAIEALEADPEDTVSRKAG
jgi:hypothetical protein